MAVFKLGDKLEVIDDSGCLECYETGEVGIVTYVRDGSYLMYTLDYKEGGMYAKRFKLIATAAELAKEKTVANGVDGDGKALNFSESDLKPFMRVVVRGDSFIVVVKDCKNFLVTPNSVQGCSGPNWLAPAFSDGRWKIEEVYNYPDSICNMLSVQHHGNLLWKRCTKTAQQIAQEKSVKELEDSIKASQEKLEQLKRSM